MRSAISSRLLLGVILALTPSRASAEVLQGSIVPPKNPVVSGNAAGDNERAGTGEPPLSSKDSAPSEAAGTKQTPDIYPNTANPEIATGDSRGLAPLAEEKSTSSQRGATSNTRQAEEITQSTSLNGETVAEKASRFDSDGTTIFHEGTVQIAMGITNLAISEQDRKANGESDDGNRLKDQGLQQIAQGQQSVSRGHDMVNQANTIGQREANLKSASTSGSSTFKPHQLAFDENHVSDDGKQALEDMEKEAGVPASSLIAAVNQGSNEGIVNLAAGAHGVEMSQAQMMAALPNFAVGGGGPAAAPSSAPKFSILAGNTPKGSAELAGGLQNKLLAKRSIEKRPTAIAQNASRPAVAMNETLEPLGHDQLFGSLGRKVASADDDSTLFFRVKRQYGKRFRDLAGKASSAQ